MSLDPCKFGELPSFLRSIDGESRSPAAKYATKKENTEKSENSECGRRGPKEQYAKQTNQDPLTLEPWCLPFGIRLPVHNGAEQRSAK